MSYNALAVLIGWIIALAIFFGFIVLLRYINHRERMAMIQQGIVPEKTWKNQRKSRGILRAGLITMMVGLSLTIGLYPIGYYLPSSFGAPYNLGPWLLPGLIPFGVGVALVISYYLEQSSQVTDEETKKKIIPIEEHLDKERNKHS